MQYFTCFNKKWVVFQSGWWIVFKSVLPYYYTYNHSFKLSFNMCNIDSTDPEDYIQVSETTFVNNFGQIS